MARHGARGLVFVLAAGLALALASGLTACSRSSDDSAPSGATESPAPSAAPMEPPPTAPSPTPAPPASTAEPAQDPTAPAIPAPVEPAAPAAFPATDESPSPPSALPAAPGEPLTPDPPAEVPAPGSAPPPVLYDTYDLRGAVTEPGHYAFLADPDDPSSVVTTYEELRDGTATALLIHTTDAHGISRTNLYDAVEVGDLFEWRQTADCFVRYQVSEVKADPTGTVPRKLLAVAWMTYAFTGCRSGAINTTRIATFHWDDLPILGGTSLHTPIVHGIYQLYPEGAPDRESGFMQWEPPADWPVLPPGTIEDLASARQLALWREPALPAGWTLGGVYVFDYPGGGYDVSFLSPRGAFGFKLVVHGMPATQRQTADPAVWRPPGNDLGIREAHVIAGRPAIFVRSGAENPNIYYSADVWIYDPATETEYILHPYSTDLMGRNYPVALALAASLFEPPNPP